MLDVDLPGIGRARTSSRRWSRRPVAILPTIFITALSNPREVDGSLAAFAPVAVLYKPFDKKDLLEAIGRACN